MRKFDDLTPYEQCIEEIVAGGYPRAMVEDIVPTFLHAVKERLRKVGDEVDVPRFGTFTVMLHILPQGCCELVGFCQDPTWWFKREG